MSLSLVEALLLVESLDKPFHIGPPQKVDLSDEHKKMGLKDYNIHDLEHGKEGRLLVFHRKGAYEIHHEEYDEHDLPTISGTIHSKRLGANPRYVATMGHVAKHLIEKGHSVRIAGTVSNGMFDKYRRIGVLLAKKHKYRVSEIKKYSVPDGMGDDMKEFTIFKPIGESAMNLIHAMILEGSNVDNNFYLPELVVGEPNFLSTKD